MDAFYASVEERDDPSLKGKPVAVGGSSRRGVVATANYEARKYGVHSAMPGYMAKQKCPEIIFVKPDFNKYKAVSKQVRDIFSIYTDLIEPLSLDEAYLDVSLDKKDIGIATKLARAIQEDVYKVTSLTCSAGVSYCKFLAKVASGHKKPAGLTVIKPNEADEFLEQLPIHAFHGIGKVTAQRMQNLGINNGADLKAFSKFDLATHFGKTGAYFYNIVRGIDNRPVVAERARKSIGAERTFSTDIHEFAQLTEKLEWIVDVLFERMEQANNYGRTVTLKLKNSAFHIITRSHTESECIKNKEQLNQIASSLLSEHIDGLGSIRLIGLSCSNLEKELSDTKFGFQLKLELE